MLRLPPMKGLPNPFHAFARFGFRSGGGHAGQWVVNDPFSDERLEQDQDFRKLRPVDPTRRDPAINDFISVPFLPVDDASSRLVARNDRRVCQEQLNAQGADYLLSAAN